MMRNKLFRAAVFLVVVSCLPLGLQAHRNGTRYFPFLEKPEEIVIKKRSHITAEFFYISVSTAQKRGGGNYGTSELWGMYDLNDILKSLTAVQGAAVTDKIRAMLPRELQDDKKIPYKTGESINSTGVLLGYEQVLPKKLDCFSLGMYLPVMYASGLGAFHSRVSSGGYMGGVKLVDGDGKPTQDGLKVDQARRAAHTALDFIGNTWSASGWGDLDLHARWNYFADHKLLMRSIDFYLQAGVIMPTGMTLDNGNPFSVPAMGDGHWGISFDALSEFELRTDWKLGIMLGGLHQCKDTRNRRLPVATEPVVYSALVGRVAVDPGFTLKFSPYFTLENLTDGVHFQIRYTYLHHWHDTWYDKRSKEAQVNFPSYLSHNNPLLTPEQRSKNIRKREALTKSTSHFFSFQGMYDAKQALRNWRMSPLIYATYDLPVSGSSIAKAHQLSLGAQLHF